MSRRRTVFAGVISGAAVIAAVTLMSAQAERGQTTPPVNGGPVKKDELRTQIEMLNQLLGIKPEIFPVDPRLAMAVARALPARSGAEPTRQTIVKREDLAFKAPRLADIRVTQGEPFRYAGLEGVLGSDTPSASGGVALSLGDEPLLPRRDAGLPPLPVLESSASGSEQVAETDMAVTVGPEEPELVASVPSGGIGEAFPMDMAEVGSPGRSDDQFSDGVANTGVTARVRDEVFLAPVIENVPDAADSPDPLASLLSSPDALSLISGMTPDQINALAVLVLAGKQPDAAVQMIASRQDARAAPMGVPPLSDPGMDLDLLVDAPRDVMPAAENVLLRGWVAGERPDGGVYVEREGDGASRIDIDVGMTLGSFGAVTGVIYDGEGDQRSVHVLLATGDKISGKAGPVSSVVDGKKENES